MPENREGLLAHYRAMRAALLAAIDGLGDATLTEPSLDGWSVKNHLLHLAAWDEIRASEVERISAGFESAWRMTPEQEPAFGQNLLRPAQGPLTRAGAMGTRLNARAAARGHRGGDTARPRRLALRRGRVA